MRIFLTMLAFAFFSFITADLPTAQAASYEEEQAMDQKWGVLDRPWKISRVRFRTVGDQPAQVKSGLPPYFQQVEDAQTISGGTGTRR